MPDWKLSSPRQIHLKEWGDEFVLFNERSGATHLLGPATAAVLLTFLEARVALSLEDLHDQLGGPSEEESELISSSLKELEQIEVIEVVPR